MKGVIWNVGNVGQKTGYAWILKRMSVRNFLVDGDSMRLKGVT